MKNKSISLILTLLVITSLATTSCFEDLGGSGDPRNSIGTITINPWPEGIVPYVKEGTFTKEEWEYLDHAMTEWAAYAAVSFVDYTEKENIPERVLYISRTEGSSSATVGYAANPQLKISTSTRMYQRYIVQLYGHVLGLLREHQRPDRDDYIEVLWSNISPEALSHYGKLNSTLIEEENFPYDSLSVMHYTRTQGNREFGLRCFEYLHQEYDTKAHYVSKGDEKKISSIYGAAD